MADQACCGSLLLKPGIKSVEMEKKKKKLETNAKKKKKKYHNSKQMIESINSVISFFSLLIFGAKNLNCK